MTDRDTTNKKEESKIVNFIEDILNFIAQHHRPINTIELYELYTPKYGSRKNSASHTEYLLKIATHTNRLKRYDRIVPNGDSLPLFPGRHKTKAASFLINTSIDELDQVELIDNYFNKLVEQAKIINERKITEQKERNKKNTIENYRKRQSLKSASSEKCLIQKIPIERSPSINYNYQQNCFIFSKHVRLHIIHTFILNTFGTREFTVKSCARRMSLDLLMKIAGVCFIPDEILKEPKLRFIIIDCFPNRFLKEFNFQQAYYQVEKLLSILESEYFILTKKRKSTYQLNITRYELQYGKNKPVNVDICNNKGILYFWRFIEIIDLIEHFDAISSAAWLKKWSLNKLRNEKPPPIVTSILKNGDLSEKRAIECEGIDLSLIGNSLRKFDTAKDLDLFCSSNQILLKKFEISDHQMALHVSSEEFKSFSDKTLRNVLCNAVSLGVVTVGGVTVKSFVPWEEVKRLVCSIFPEFSNKEPIFFMRAHANAMWSVRGYKEAFESSVALSIAAVKTVKEEENDMLYEVSEQQIRDRFNIARMMLQMPPKIAELVEALKRKFCSKIRYYSTNQEQKFLQEFDWNCSHDALLALRFINYITRVQGPDARMPVFIRSNSFMKGIWRDKNFYNDLVVIQNEIKRMIFSPFPPVHKLTATYFETVLSINSEINVEINFESLTRGNTSLLLDLTCKLIPLPLLPEIEVSDQNFEIKSKKKNTNKSEVLLNSLNEANYILERLGYNNSIPFLLTLSFITFSGSDGISLKCIIKEMEPIIPLASDVIYCVDFLEGFGFIFKLNSTSIIPRFVSSTELPLKTSRIGHIYTGINRNISRKLSRDNQMAVFESITDKPGIEILELLKELPHISFFDLMEIVEALIADEAIYCIESSNISSLWGNQNIPNIPMGKYQLALIIAETEIDPTIERPQRKLYPTRHGALMLSHLGCYE